ncbi:zinc-dependent alcohol dehydrogenase family protein [Actinopolyspora mortivallis]|uniref:zinc-dependent alcohol dehydrogenase family protein n=1 Tax=Actinopolyspora mortivallis TaxID=33906 RepID=UPI00036CEB16|nr:zinc-dependent alcohol dehydrogenase family protein [Actinopolyspora mortivallis]
MRAVVFRRHGVPEEVLDVLSDLPVPRPGGGQVLVRLHARPVNPADLLYVEGRYGRRAERFPAAVGFEGSGTVEAVGEGASPPVGARVAVAARGTWREYVLAEADELVRVPDELPHEVACQATINPVTVLALLEVLNLERGATLVHTAAASTLGRMLLPVAERAGIRCVCVVRGGAHTEELTRLGAAAVVDGECEPVEEVLREYTGGGAEAALDAVGGELGSRVLRCVRSGGRFVSYGMLSGEPLRIAPESLVFEDLRVEGFWLPVYLARLTSAERSRLVARAVDLLSDPRCRPVVGERFDLSEATRAVAHAGRSHRGKVVLTG